MKQVRTQIALSGVLAAAAVTLTGTGSAASAQETAIEHCRQMSSEELRIACLEAALEAAYRLGGPEDRPNVRPDASAGAADSPQSQEGGFLRRLNPFAGDEADAGDERNRLAQSRTPAASSLGAEQVEARNRERQSFDSGDDRLVTAIAGVETVPYRRLQITLDNGMVWRQIAGDVQRIRVDEDDVSTVEIWETRLGGYKLKLNEIGRTIRVERVR